MKRFFYLLTMLFTLQISAQSITVDSARNYINTNINTNGLRAITGLKMNTALNLILSAFPNNTTNGYYYSEIEFISETRYLQTSDANKILFLFPEDDTTPVNLILPDTAIFNTGDRFMVNFYSNSAIEIFKDQPYLYPLKQKLNGFDTLGNSSERIEFIAFNFDNSNILIPITSTKTDKDGNVLTTSKYLIDRTFDYHGIGKLENGTYTINDALIQPTSIIQISNRSGVTGILNATVNTNVSIIINSSDSEDEGFFNYSVKY